MSPGRWGAIATATALVMGVGALVARSVSDPAMEEKRATDDLSTSFPVESANSQDAAHAALVAVPSSDAPHPTLAAAPAGQLVGKDATIAQQILAHFATGDYVKALRIADDHAAADGTSESLHEWIIAQLPVLLTSAGWTRLKLGDCDEATQYLRRAEALVRTLETSKGLAVCYYKQKNVGAAREQFDYYLEKKADDAQMLFLFADTLESEGSYEEAVRVLERASELPADPAHLDKAAVAERLSSMRARAKAGGLQNVETSRNFRLGYRAGDHEDLVTYVIQTLEDALDEFVEGYGLQLPQSAIEVVLYPAGDFGGIVAGGPEWAEGLFDGRLRIPISDAQLAAAPQYGSLPVVLRHELVHALVSLASGARQLPSWFDEGLAQRVACGPSGCGTFSFPASPGQLLTAAAFSLPYTSYDAAKAGRAYSQSLFLVEVLERRYGEGALRQLVSAITPTSDPTSDGLLKVHGLTFRDLHGIAADLWNRRQPPTAAAR